jgi:hypothetical protein
MSAEAIESLADIWPMQAELNKRSGFDTGALGEALRAAEAGGTLPDEGGLRTEIGKAIKNYVDAMSAECHELQECLSWKHWYREASNPLFPALRSGPTTAPGASLQKQIPSSKKK